MKTRNGIYLFGRSIFLNFHWRIFHTGLQRDPLSISLAAWPMGSLEVSFLKLRLTTPPAGGES